LGTTITLAPITFAEGYPELGDNPYGILKGVVDLGTVIIATGFAAGVDLVFGIYPAWRAADAHPIEAL